VILASPGGALIAGLQIDKVIRLYHFTTFVSQGEYCASACALAWLAGEPLVMRTDRLFPGARPSTHYP